MELGHACIFRLVYIVLNVKRCNGIKLSFNCFSEYTSKLGQENFSTGSLHLLLIQAEQLSVTGERTCRRLAQEQCGQNK